MVATVKNAGDAKVADHFSANVFPQILRVLGANFQSTPFLSIDAVGSDFWPQLHELINGVTH